MRTRRRRTLKQLADIDKSTLEKLVVDSIVEARRRYGKNDGA
jgi:hypothetical protein